MHTFRLLLLLGGMLTMSHLSAQSTALLQVRGRVKDANTQQPLEGVEVRLATVAFFSDARGNIDFTTAVPSNGKLTITLSKAGFADQTLEVASGRSGVELGQIALAPREGTDLNQAEDFIPTIALSTNEQEAEGEQNISGLLTASTDVFVSAAAFNFGAARFRMRGYEAPTTEVYLNGTPVNDLESGFPNWNLWSGLNDVVRSRNTSIGLAVNPMAYGGIGGSTAFDTRASRQRQQLRVGYAVANRAYTNRVMATYATGLLKSGWAVSLSASRRWAQEGYVPGTFYDAYSYFLSVDRQLGKTHLLNLTALGAPVQRGRAGASTQEMYDLAGTNYYNPNWGYQNGEKRNARVANTHQPLIILRHDWTPRANQRLTSAVSYQTGRNGVTALDWYEARDPRPDYYRRLPSYIDNEQAEAVAEELRTNEPARQIDWAYLYEANRNSVATILNANGQAGNTVTGKRAQYVLEERRFDRQRLAANLNWEQSFADQFRFTAGANYQWQKVHNFKVLADLLGADFYVDIDKFAEFDSTGNVNFYQNNLDVPNRLVQEGDVFGYDFNNLSQRVQGWAQLDATLAHWDFFIAGNVAQQSFWREGLVRNGKFPENSAGNSARTNFVDFGAKAGLTYKLDGRNYFVLNGGYQRQSPFLRNAFVSPRTRDQLTPGLSQESVVSLEGGYLLRAPYAKLRLMGYFTEFSNQLSSRSFYLDNAIATDDGFRGGFVNYVMTGIATRHMGVELGGEFNLGPAWRVRTAAAIGQYVYTSRPEVFVYLDNVAQEIRQDQVYLKNFKLPNTPQTAGTVSLSYNSPKFWFASLSANYFDRIWIDINPERRTNAAVSYTENPQFSEQIVEPGSALWNEIILQEQLPSALTLDFFGGKSWKLNDHTFLYLNIGVNNLLDKTDFAIGGYEQFRFDYAEKNVDRFPNRYFYSFGRNYFVSLAIRI